MTTAPPPTRDVSGRPPFERPEQLLALAESVLAFLGARLQEVRRSLEARPDPRRISDLVERRVIAERAHAAWLEIHKAGRWAALDGAQRARVRATLATGRYDEVVRRAY